MLRWLRNLFKRRTLIATITEFPGLEYYRKVNSGEMTLKEYSQLKEKDLRPRVTRIYETKDGKREIEKA